MRERSNRTAVLLEGSSSGRGEGRQEAFQQGELRTLGEEALIEKNLCDEAVDERCGGRGELIRVGVRGRFARRAPVRAHLPYGPARVLTAGVMISGRGGMLLPRVPNACHAPPAPNFPIRRTAGPPRRPRAAARRERSPTVWPSPPTARCSSSPATLTVGTPGASPVCRAWPASASGARTRPSTFRPPARRSAACPGRPSAARTHRGRRDPGRARSPLGGRRNAAHGVPDGVPLAGRDHRRRAGRGRRGSGGSYSSMTATTSSPALRRMRWTVRRGPRMVSSAGSGRRVAPRRRA